MEFIEMAGRTLLRIVGEEASDGSLGELSPDQLRAVGVTDQSIVRINRQGDIELRRHNGWDVIGGLLGEFDHRVQRETGLDWA